MKENKIGGIPVVSTDSDLVGIVTNRDLRFEKNQSRPISQVMTSLDNLITTQLTDLRMQKIFYRPIKSKSCCCR